MGKQPRVRPSFTDDKGRTWHLRVSLGAIDAFERSVGHGILGEILNAAAESESDDLSDADILRLAAKLFGEIKNVLVLIYESCRSAETGVVENPTGTVVSFEDFARSIGQGTLYSAAAATMQAVFHFVTPEGVDEEMEAGENPENPPTSPQGNPSLGDIYTLLQRLPDAIRGAIPSGSSPTEPESDRPKSGTG